MALTEIELATLKVELNGDPESLGYTDDDPVCAALLNEIGLSNEEIDVGVIDGQELQKAVVGSEFLALTPEKQRFWLAIVSAGSGKVDINDQAVIDQATAIWAGTTTLINLGALQERSASRAEALFGRGSSVTHTDVAKARVV